MAETTIANGAGSAPCPTLATFKRSGRIIGPAGQLPSTFPERPPSVELQAKQFLPYGFSSFTEPPVGPVVNLGSGELGDYFPSLGNGPTEYPAGVRYFRTRTSVYHFSNSGDEHGPYDWTYIDRVTWDDTNLRMVASEEVISDGEELLSLFWDAWYDQYVEEAGISPTEEEVAEMIANFMRENSSYSDSSYTFNMTATKSSGDVINVSLTVTLTDEDTWGDIVARAASFRANATDAQWAQSGAGDAAGMPSSPLGSWRGYAAQSQNGLLFRPANPATLAGFQDDKFVIVLRYHHVLATLTASFAGAWTHMHRVLSFPACPTTLGVRNSIVQTSSPDPDDARSNALNSVDRSSTVTTTDTWSLPIVDGWFDQFGSPSSSPDAGWTGRPWMNASIPGATGEVRTITWGKLQGINVALKARVVALDGRSGWTCKLHGRREITRGVASPLETVDHAMTTAGGGVSNVEHIAPYIRAEEMAATELRWIAPVSLVSILDPSGVAVADALAGTVLRLEYQIRFCTGTSYNLSTGIGYLGPTGIWYRKRTRTIVTESNATAAPVSCAISASTATETKTTVYEWSPLAAAETLKSATFERTANGVPLDEADALQISALTWIGLGDVTETTTESPTTRVRVQTYAAAGDYDPAPVFMELFPIGWSAAREPLLDLSAGTAGLLLQALEIETPEDVEAVTEEMVREGRAAPYTAVRYRTPWRTMLLDDVDVVTCITDGWADWTAPE